MRPRRLCPLTCAWPSQAAPPLTLPGVQRAGEGAAARGVVRGAGAGAGQPRQAWRQLGSVHSRGVRPRACAAHGRPTLPHPSPPTPPGGGDRGAAGSAVHAWAPRLTLSASFPASPPVLPACQVAAIREQLAALYEAQEEWSKAAHALAGIDLDSGMRLLDAGGWLGWLGGAERWVGDGRPASWAHRMRLPGAERGSDADCWCAGSPRSPGRRSSARAAKAGRPLPSCLAACYPTATCCLLPAECKLGKRAKVAT